MTKQEPNPNRPSRPIGRLPSPERGLPGRADLVDLAKTYVLTQRRLWPELAKSGALPEATDNAYERMADQFTEAFLSGQVNFELARSLSGPWKALATFYGRYSDDSSNPRSLAQQMVLGLERAHRENLFVLWQLVFADAAVTGTTAARQGYQLAKSIVATSDNGIQALLIDEIGRASRDMIESLWLGREVERNHKRMIGVSDGFDSDQPHWKIVLSIFAALQEWFIDQLRSKVHRGMNDAFRRGKNTHPPAVGYKLVPATDDAENRLYDHKGKLKMTKVIDEDQAHFVLEAFRLLVEERWSRKKIARWFNDQNVAGRRSWNSSSILQLLKRRTYIGIEVFRTVRYERDPETGRRRTIGLPRKDWLIRRARQLAFVPVKLFMKARRRLKVVREAYAKRAARSPSAPNRSDLHPTMLFRPICEHCQQPLQLGHSGEYPALCCANGTARKHGCELNTYKSVRIIENAMLKCLRDKVLSPEFLEKAVLEANKFLADESQRPREDTTALERGIAVLATKRNRLAKAIEDEDAADLKVLIKRLRHHETELEKLRSHLRAIQSRNAVPPPPIDLDAATAMLEDLRGLLNQDVGVAAPILRDLTGPISITQVREEGKRGATWIAKFHPDFFLMLERLGAGRGYPSTTTLEYLNSRGWRMPIDLELPLVESPRNAHQAPKFKELYDSGVPIRAIAQAHGIYDDEVRRLIQFAATKEWGPMRYCRERAKNGKPSKVERHADEVVRLRDQERMSFPKIGMKLGIGDDTARRAYDFARPEVVKLAIENGGPIRRGKIHASKQWEAQRLLQAGLDDKEVQKRVGCSKSTILLAKKRLPGKDAK